jgi:hypothetical protein
VTRIRLRYYHTPPLARAAALSQSGISEKNLLKNVLRSERKGIGILGKVLYRSNSQACQEAARMVRLPRQMGGSPRKKPQRGRKRFSSSQANRDQLRAFRDICKRLNLDDDEQEEFHDAITGVGLDYQGLKRAGEGMFPNGGSFTK